jgi:hypothetical protein
MGIAKPTKREERSPKKNNKTTMTNKTPEIMLFWRLAT